MVHGWALKGGGAIVALIIVPDYRFEKGTALRDERFRLLTRGGRAGGNPKAKNIGIFESVQHPSYLLAKSGNVGAAFQLVLDAIDNATIGKLAAWAERGAPVLISVHAEEQVGVNAIPAVLADSLGFMLDWEVERIVVQANVVNHTGASGFARLARQAFFSGEIDPSRA